MIFSNQKVIEKVESCRVLAKDWRFFPSQSQPEVYLHRLKAYLFGRRAPPERQILKAPSPRPRWVLYFMYLPDGVLAPSHRFSLERLAALDAGLFAVCALPPDVSVPSGIYDFADAVVSKGLGGYDFSAYALGLREIVKSSPGCDLFVLNDSVFGPFVDLEKEFDSAQWDFTGYTAFSLIENHIQSYAFILKGADARREGALRAVLPTTYAYNRYKDVVFQQETKLARVASQTMSVGAKWFADHRTSGDASFFSALSLLEAGFPFMKKSLLYKRPDIYDRKVIVSALEELGHPVP